MESAGNHHVTVEHFDIFRFKIVLQRGKKNQTIVQLNGKIHKMLWCGLIDVWIAQNGGGVGLN